MNNYNHALANSLDCIALGVAYSEAALYDAYSHNVTTSNDKQLITRFLNGNQTANDSHNLQQLAIYIREAV